MIIDSEGQAPLFLQLATCEATAAAACRPRTYEDILALAKQLKRTVDNTLALDESHDPYYVGLPRRRKMAEWFVPIWAQHGGSNAHLRRIHYRLVTQPTPILKPDGEPYINEMKDWDLLVSAAGGARYLGLIPADVLNDNKHPKAVVPWGWSPDNSDPYLSWPEYGHYWGLPTLPVFNTEWNIDPGGPRVGGYDYSPRAQPYHLEIWIEKSTMDDILDPICSRYRVVKQQVIGFASITRVLDCLKRIFGAGKPARIFYINDYDPAGKAMGPAVARQLEFWLDEYAPGADIKLIQLMLTRAQIDRYRLPKTPIKDKDPRRTKFENAHGKGGVELDALEAIVPGVFGDIVRHALLPYVDTAIEETIDAQRSEIEDAVEAAWQDATEEPRHAIARIEHEVQAVLADFAEEYEALRQRIAEALAPYDEAITAELEEIAHIQANFTHELPPVATSELEVHEQDERWLFDSHRDYLTQLDFYKRNKVGDIQEEEEEEDE